jgi:hypothetical protein
MPAVYPSKSIGFCCFYFNKHRSNVHSLATFEKIQDGSNRLTLTSNQLASNQFEDLHNIESKTSSELGALNFSSPDNKEYSMSFGASDTTDVTSSILNSRPLGKALSLKNQPSLYLLKRRHSCTSVSYVQNTQLQKQSVKHLPPLSVEKNNAPSGIYVNKTLQSQRIRSAQANFSGLESGSTFLKNGADMMLAFKNEFQSSYDQRLRESQQQTINNMLSSKIQSTQL